MPKPRIVGWDTETHLIQPDMPVPPMVCLTASGGEDTWDIIRRWDSRLPADMSPAVGACHDLWFRIRHSEEFGLEWEVCIPRDRALDLMLVFIESGVVLCAMNQAFDWSIMFRYWRQELLGLHTWLVETGRAVDVGIREQLIAIACDNFQYDQRIQGRLSGFGLAHCVAARFGVDLSDKVKLSTLRKNGVPKSQWPWRYRYDELDGVPLDQWPERALVYATEDSVWARRLYLDQATPLALPEGEVVRQDGTVVNEREQFAFAQVLRNMSAEQGVATDPAAVMAFEHQVDEWVAEAEAAGMAAGFMVINRCKPCHGTGMAGEVPHLQVCGQCGGQDHETLIRLGGYGFFKNGKPKAPAAPKTAKSTKRLRELVSHAYAGCPPMTDKGAVSTASSTLEGSGNPLLEKYAEGSFAIKLRDTYVPILQRPVVYSSPRVLVRSGRTSWRAPNLQNPPQRGGFRECFRARPGMVFASIDYSTLELCTLAQSNLVHFGYSKMAEAINAGQDLHLAFACKAYLNMPYEEALAIRKDPEHPRYAEVKERRDRAKPANFGFPGGLGTQTFVEYAAGYGISLSFNEAEDLRNSWFEMWPEMQDFFARISHMSSSSTDGRFASRLWSSGRIRGGCSYTSGANTEFQGPAADGAKAAGWALYKESQLDPTSPLFGVGMWGFIHDEYLFEGPEETSHLWAPRAVEVMEEEMAKYCPDVRVAAEPALSYKWTKKAEPVYVDGKLVPWTEEGA